MSPGETAALVAAVAGSLLVVGALLALGSLMRTLRSARAVLDDVRTVAVPLLVELHVVVRQATSDLSRVDNLLDRAESISGTVDSASRLAFGLFGNPTVKAMALASGGARAFRRLRRRRRGAAAS